MNATTEYQQSSDSILKGKFYHFSPTAFTIFKDRRSDTELLYDKHFCRHMV